MRCYNLKIIILTLFVLSGHSAFCQTPQVEIASYDVKVKLDSSDNQLHVTVGLEIQKADTINEFEMLLTSDAKMSSIKYRLNHNWIDTPTSSWGKILWQEKVSRVVLDTN